MLAALHFLWCLACNQNIARSGALFWCLTVGWHSAAQAQLYLGTDAQGVITLSSYYSKETPLIISGRPEHQDSKVFRHPVADIRHDRFREHVAFASAQTGVPEALIQAVIRVESNFNPAAVSSKGARGLMQVMPATGKRFGAIDLDDPKDNILVGSRYLRYLLEFFNQDLELTLAAYNAGEGAVLRAGRKLPNFVETAQYVPKVLDHYQRLQNR